MAHTSGQASHPEVFGQHKWHVWGGGRKKKMKVLVARKMGKDLGKFGEGNLFLASMDIFTHMHIHKHKSI